MDGLSEALQRRGIQKLFYYLHEANLPSVLTHGILSRKVVLQRGLKFMDISSPKYQLVRSGIKIAGTPLQDFVPLFINPENPMFRFASSKWPRDLCCLIVAVRVADKEGVYFTNGTLGRDPRSRKVLCKPEEVRQLNLTWVNSRDFSDGQQQSAEVLVPISVDSTYIRHVFVMNPTKRDLPALPEGMKYRELDWGGCSTFWKLFRGIEF